jgi:hypothetical protein
MNVHLNIRSDQYQIEVTQRTYKEESTEICLTVTIKHLFGSAAQSHRKY